MPSPRDAPAVIRAGLWLVAVGAAAAMPVLVGWGCTFESQGGGQGPGPGLAVPCLTVAIRYPPAPGALADPSSPPGAAAQLNCEAVTDDNIVSWTLARADEGAPNLVPQVLDAFAVTAADEFTCFAESSFSDSVFEALGVGAGTTFEVVHRLGIWSVTCPPIAIEACVQGSPGSSHSSRFGDECVVNEAGFPPPDPAPCFEAGAEGEPCGDGLDCCSGVCEDGLCVGN